MKKKILYVDNDSFSRNLMGNYMNSYEVDFAKDGIEAIFKSKKKKYDLIVIDTEVPEMNGYEVSLYLNNLKSGVPILGVSNSEKNECVAKFYGMKKVINKIISKESFLKAVETILVV